MTSINRKRNARVRLYYISLSVINIILISNLYYCLKIQEVLSRLAILLDPEAILDLIGQKISYLKTTTPMNNKRLFTKRGVYLNYFGIWLEGLFIVI